MREWKTCPLNRNYKISNDGLCKSRHPRFEERFLTPAPRQNTKVYVLCEKYTKHAYPIRHLVYTTFVGPVPKGYVVFNKDGNPDNNVVENLGVMPLGDKLFYYCKYRVKKVAKELDKGKFVFRINDKLYKTSRAVVKDYPIIGTRQNLCHQADRWLNGQSKRRTSYNPNGFEIKGIFIWCTKSKGANFVKKRMDRIKTTYDLQGKEDQCQQPSIKS